jgi:hypothetical protein
MVDRHVCVRVSSVPFDIQDEASLLQKENRSDKARNKRKRFSKGKEKYEIKKTGTGRKDDRECRKRCRYEKTIQDQKWNVVENSQKRILRSHENP